MSTSTKSLDITGLDKGRLLAALFAFATPGSAESMGWMQWQPGTPKAEQFAEVAAAGYVDYLQGRCLKVDVSGDQLDPFLYDRQYGGGSAERIVAGLRP